MKKAEMKGIANDLVQLNSWRSPLEHVSIPKAVVMNLITKELVSSGEDDITDFLKEKQSWFMQRIIEENLNLMDFGECLISINGSTENVSLCYKGKIFESSATW